MSSSKAASGGKRALSSQTRAASGVVIVGAGLAGLFCALKLGEWGIASTVVAAAHIGEGAASAWAQGGIAAAVGHGDTPDDHARDTVAAGAGLVDPAVALSVALEAPDRVRDLLAYGVPFDRDRDGRFVLSREAAHGAARVVRVSGDRAGAAIMAALIAKVRLDPRIDLVEEAIVDDLSRDPRTGLWALVLASAADTGTRRVIVGAHDVVLATGGIGGLYLRSTNPPLARGTGLALAARAGAAVADAEFVQFHPTAIDVPATPTPLASEALRGEGALLIDASGRRFMVGLHPEAELAPRDIVARAVARQLAEGRGAFLDCRAAIGHEFPRRFPTIFAKCLEAGINPVTQPIPVAPAEHYHMGGIATDACGRTSLAGLWAIGEVASTGLHGANRLASNSLIEATVFASRTADAIAATTAPDQPPAAIRSIGPHSDPAAISPPERSALIERIRSTMSAHAGVERSGQGLLRASQDLRQIAREASADRMLTLMTLTARFVVEAALRRCESRGAQFRTDYPDADPAAAHRRALRLHGTDIVEAVLPNANPIDAAAKTPDSTRQGGGS
ncbi:MAG: L-aspartate oxidase [Hyphomicrobiaceae bacterium]